MTRAGDPVGAHQPSPMVPGGAISRRIIPLSFPTPAPGASTVPRRRVPAGQRRAVTCAMRQVDARLLASATYETTSVPSIKARAGDASGPCAAGRPQVPRSSLRSWKVLDSRPGTEVAGGRWECEAARATGSRVFAFHADGDSQVGIERASVHAGGSGSPSAVSTSATTLRTSLVFRPAADVPGDLEVTVQAEPLGDGDVRRRRGARSAGAATPQDARPRGP
jgi:hypothetical protein